jgi:ribosomal protein S6--L-glutamate ligase
MKAALISMGSKSSLWLAKAMKNYFDKVENLDIRNIELNLSSKEYDVLHKGKKIEDYDCVYAKGSYKYADLLRALTTALCKKAYMPIKASAFNTGHDKLLTQLKLQQHKIPMPTTYLASTPTAAKKILEKINYPIIMKFPHGTQGKGVMFADSFASASSMLDALTTLKQPFIIQEYIETGGVDTRAIVVGEKVVAAMKRKAVEGEERANIHAGGKGEPCELDAYTKKIAVESAKAIKAEICAVDMLEGAKGPVVIEVNLSPGLQGITEVTKIDITDKIAKYLYKKTKCYHEAEKETNASRIFQEVGIRSDKAKEIITGIDLRGNRILLPEVITKITKFNEKNELIMEAEEGALRIKKLDVGEEKK